MSRWPETIQAQIEMLSLDNESQHILNDMRRSLHVKRDDSKSSQFQAIPTSQTLHAPLTPSERRIIPTVLFPLYSSFPATAQFHMPDTGLMFKNRHEITESARQLPSGMIDLAYHPAGMGLLYIHTYIKDSGKVLTTCCQIPHSHWPFYNTRTKRHILLDNFADNSNTKEIIVHNTFAQWWKAYSSRNSYSDS